jgi:type I restriction enzyme, S subunit
MKQGWEIKKLIEVCEELFAGGDVPKGNSSKIETDAFRVPIYSNGEKNKGLYGYTNVARVTMPSITISARGTIGYSEIRKEAFYPAIRLIVVIPNTNILELSFLKHVISSIDFIHSGSSIPQLTVPMIKEYPIPLPPLPEQKRIVTILDKAFASIDKAKANAEQNLNNAKDLFESYLNSSLSNKQWEIKPLGESCNKAEYGSSKKSKSEGLLPVLRMGNIQNREFVWDKLVYSDDVDDNKQYLLKFNDVLFNRTNSPELVGKTAIYKGEMPAIFAGYLIRLHRNDDLLDAEYLNYYLNSNMAFDYGKTVMISSVNQANINATKLKSYPIPLPSLKEQQTIVKKLDALSSETKKLKTIYQKKIDNLEDLKKSVLQKAFNGELT